LAASIREPNLDNIKNMILGGAPVSNELHKAIQNMNTRVFETYGMTETCSHIAIKPLNGKTKSEFFSILPGFQISKDKRECLVITLSDGTILTTNDIIELEDGKFKWLGRYDNVINSGGIKLFPEQIEKKLEPVISYKFIVVSEKHNTLGEQVVLLIEWPLKESDFNLNQFITELNGVLSSFERPKKLYLLPEFIETSNGKIQRKETKASIKGKTGYVL
jgi:O-succinylbenzoic acid--CoA ligase